MPFLKDRDNSNLPGEIWRPIEGWPYSVSSLGRVRRDAGGQGARAGIILRQKLAPTGYPMVALCKHGKQKSFLVHRLVCAAFHGPPPSEKLDAAHQNGKRKDNRAANLKWMTRTDNNFQKFAHGTMIFGEDHPNSKLTVQVVKEIRRLHIDDLSLSQIAQILNINRATINNVVRGSTWKHVP